MTKRETPQAAGGSGFRWRWLAALTLATWTAVAAPSHPPLRPAPPVSQRPATPGPAYYVDPVAGRDDQAGTQAAPWRLVQTALGRLRPGDTLYLRGGVYYERLYCALAGTAEQPIVIRSFPGEQAIVDGGWAEFMTAPATAWEPVTDGAPGEYRSRLAYPNERDILGSLGDCMVGLSTYYHRQDLQATNELADTPPGTDRKTTDLLPLYCGPGLWYNPADGRIHARLAATHLTGVPNYAGPADPRQVPLVIAPFRSVPLTLDRARHVVVQDLVIRGGGYDSVIITNGEQVTLDGVTVWCTSYGLRVSGTVGLRLLRSRLYGNCPPWLARSDTSKRAYPGRPFRDITRLNTHASLVIENGREFAVFATPVNDDWEIAWCEFTDAHDGPYLGGINLRFHHNLIEGLQDDGIYLSQMYPRHIYGGGGAELHLYQNVFRQMLTCLAFGGSEDTRDRVYVYRNLFDLRAPVYTGRAASDSPQPRTNPGKVIGDHGSPPWPELLFYQNTVVLDSGTPYAAAVMTSIAKDHPRRVLNNLIVELAGSPFPLLREPADLDLVADGQLYWSPKLGLEALQKTWQQRMAAKVHAQRAELKLPPWESKVTLADPLFVNLPAAAAEPGDFRVQPTSPAKGAGVPLPAEWPDPLRPADQAAPDVGAFPLGAAPLAVGSQAAP